MSLGQLLDEMYFEAHEPICEECGKLLTFEEWELSNLCYKCAFEEICRQNG